VFMKDQGANKATTMAAKRMVSPKAMGSKKELLIWARTLARAALRWDFSV